MIHPKSDPCAVCFTHGEYQASHTQMDFVDLEWAENRSDHQPFCSTARRELTGINGFFQGPTVDSKKSWTKSPRMSKGMRRKRRRKVLMRASRMWSTQSTKCGKISLNPQPAKNHNMLDRNGSKLATEVVSLKEEMDVQSEWTMRKSPPRRMAMAIVKVITSEHISSNFIHHFGSSIACSPR